MRLVSDDGWSITVAAYTMASGNVLNGECLVVKRHGFLVKTVRTIAEAAAFVPLHTLKEVTS